ncbi:MAG: TIGR00266 family protein [Bacillota bacterium]|nr:TIGR00266 family protein [Bacillota bacterium]
MAKAHEIDYQIYGEDMQFVEISLDPGETVIAEAGAMVYMDGDIHFETILGTGSEREKGKGLMGRLIGAGKRLLAGEDLFMTAFTNQGRGKKAVAFAAPYPGKIIPVDLAACGGQLICQRDAFLCAAKGIDIEIFFQKKIGAGLFSAEGFILQRLVGDGLAFLHSGGTIIKKELQAGEVLKLETGCLVAMTESIDFDVTLVSSFKSALFGGEGLFLVTLEGPGSVWIQSLPFSHMVDRIISVGNLKRDDD